MPTAPTSSTCARSPTPSARDVNGDDVTYVVNRNINFTNVCYTGCRFCAFAQRRTDADAYTLSMQQVGDRVDEAWAAGATEICMQGGIHPDLPGTAYFDLAREVKKRQPGIHLHAFSPMEIVNGAARTGLSFTDFLTAAKEAGLDSIPGTAAEILDDDVRWVLTKGKLPTATWLEIIPTAHRVGIPTTSTMMYGHVDTPAHWVAHLRTLAALQDETGGFTEFVLLPFVHHNSPIYLAGVARPGPTVRENRAVHAVARLLLHGRIPNIQTSWVKLADAGTKAVLQGGANDLGGTLMEETISRMAGSENGSLKTIAELEAMAAAIGRPARQRTTEYGTPSAERLATARSDEGRRAHPVDQPRMRRLLLICGAPAPGRPTCGPAGGARAGPAGGEHRPGRVAARVARLRSRRAAGAGAGGRPARPDPRRRRRPDLHAGVRRRSGRAA